MTISWPVGTQQACCPVCILGAAHQVVVEAAARRFLRCAACGTVFAADNTAPSYASDGPLDETVQYYVEQLAAIDTIVDPLFTLDPAAIRHYAEIGCSFGFALDFGRHAFGWQVRGVDPSALATAGGPALGLPIEPRLFTEEHPLAPPPADLLVGSEVLEHVPDPHAFLRGLCASLAPAGVLVLTMPNAAAVQPATPHPVLMQVLCPGYHLVLPSAAGLRRLVEAHGFLHHHIRETPAGLTVFACRQPFAWNPQGRTDRAAYVRYLHARMCAAPPGSTMECGMLYRLLREHAAFAQWTEAEALVPRILHAYAQRGVHLADPATCRPGAPQDASFTEYARRHPMNVGGVLYALGLVAMLHRRDDAHALACFDAAAAWLGRVRQVLAGFGTTDAESDGFERLAMGHAMALLARRDPGGTLARLRALPEAEAGLLSVVAFIELVNAGNHAEAAAVQSAAAAAKADDPVLDARRLVALGIHALNGQGDQGAARRWLRDALAVVAGSDDLVLADLGRAAAAALRLAEPPPVLAPLPAPPRRASWLRRLAGRQGSR